MDRPQGANGDRNLEVNDVVLLPRKESVLVTITLEWLIVLLREIMVWSVR